VVGGNTISSIMSAIDAERVIILMGPGAETAGETAHTGRARERALALKVRSTGLFRSGIPEALPPHRALYRGFRSHQGARRGWRAAYQDVVTAINGRPG
jgi:hypothetical protein